MKSVWEESGEQAEHVDCNSEGEPLDLGHAADDGEGNPAASWVALFFNHRIT